MSGIFIVDLRCNCGWTKVLSFQRNEDPAWRPGCRIDEGGLA